MKYAQLLHNPSAGEGELTKKDLLNLVESVGFECSYSSTKKRGWRKLDLDEKDFIIIAGGDGTVRKVAEELLNKKLLDKKLPIGLLPLGTANNVAKALGLATDHHQIVSTWDSSRLKKYDVGKVYGLSKAEFFLEGLGYGVFPRLMQEMSRQDPSSIDSPEKEIAVALKLMHEIILSYDGRFCRIEIESEKYTGNFLMVEVLNNPSIGPNLNLADNADPGDGELEIVLIREEQREEFASYVMRKIEGKEHKPFFETLKAKNLKIHWEGKAIHVDDERIQMNKSEAIRIELLEGMLGFLV